MWQEIRVSGFLPVLCDRCHDFCGVFLQSIWGGIPEPKMVYDILGSGIPTQEEGWSNSSFS